MIVDDYYLKDTQERSDRLDWLVIQFSDHFHFLLTFQYGAYRKQGKPIFRLHLQIKEINGVVL
jgi:hypothetical protein